MATRSALTPKREKFAQGVASGKTQADAYREAFNAVNMTAKQIHEQGSIIANNPKVAERIAELREPVIRRVQITLESHLAMLAELREEARASMQISAAIAAETARGKASGLYVEKLQHTGADGGPVQVTRVDLVPMGPGGGLLIIENEAEQDRSH